MGHRSRSRGGGRTKKYGGAGERACCSGRFAPSAISSREFRLHLFDWRPASPARSRSRVSEPFALFKTRGRNSDLSLLATRAALDQVVAVERRQRNAQPHHEAASLGSTRAGLSQRARGICIFRLAISHHAKCSRAPLFCSQPADETVCSASFSRLCKRSVGPFFSAN